MLVRNAMLQEEVFAKEEEQAAKRAKVAALRKDKPDPMAVKVHNEKMATRFNEIQKFDRDYLDVAGVSPIRCRHEIDLYGVKSGLGKFNPIMVENINKLPEPEDFEHPEILKNMAAKSAKKEAKDPKSAQKKVEKSPVPAPGKVKTPSKLILTN